MLTRRVFLRGSAVVMAGAGTAPAWLARAAAGEGKRKKILAAIFQRGAADGLNIGAPFSEKRYSELRPTIALPAPGDGPNLPVDLDGHFALHPQLRPLKALWDKKQLAIVHAAGSPDPSRSHFDAQDSMESGTPGKTASDGWLNRVLTAPAPDASPLRAVAFGARMPLTLRGARDAVSLNDTYSFQMGSEETASIIESMYAGSADARLGATGKEAFAAMRMIQSVNRQPYSPTEATSRISLRTDCGSSAKRSRSSRAAWATAWKISCS